MATNGALLRPYQGGCYVDIASTPDADSSYISSGIVVNAMMDENYSSWNTVTLSIQVLNADKISPALTALSLTSNPQVYFRFGVAAGDTAIWRPWEKFWLTYMDLTPTPAGIGAVLTVKLADLLFAFSQDYKTFSRKGVISDIFSAICAEHQFEVVTEKTIGKYALVQSFDTDFNFIRARLCPRAMNSAQAGNYVMYQKESKIYFTTVDYTKTLSSVWSIPFNTADCYVENFQVFDNSRLLYNSGGAGVRAVVVNPKGKSLGDVMSKSDKSLKMSTVQGKSSGNSVLNIFRHTFDNVEQEVVSLPQAIYAGQRLGFYQIKFSIPQMPRLQVGHFLEVSLLDAAWAGTYLVVALRHVISSNQLISYVTAVRGETNFQKAGTSIAPNDGSPLVNAYDAQGQDPRIITTSNPGASISVVRDANTAMLA